MWPEQRARERGVRDEVRAGAECRADLVRLHLHGVRWEATGGSGSGVSGVTERMRVVYHSSVRLRRDCDGARAGESHGTGLRKPQ